MKHAVSLLERLMEAVALRAGDPGGGRDWNHRVQRILDALDATFEQTARSGGMESDRLRFLFAADEVVLDNEPLWTLRGWPWIDRLTSSGIGAIHLGRPVSHTQVGNFVIDLEAALAGEGIRDVRSEPGRWGPLELIPGGTPGGESPPQTSPRSGSSGSEGLTPEVSAPPPFPGDGELDVATWVHLQVARGESLPHVEAEALVRVLAAGLRVRSRSSLRLHQPATPEAYAGTHGLNTALLAMVVADERGFNAREIWEVGLAGLLHDVGMNRVSPRLFHTRRRLETPERELIEAHPRDGARIMMECGAPLVVPAIVAWEHHLRFDGGGYPKRVFGREPHPASRIVHLVSTYNALRVGRPYSPAWKPPRILEYIRSGLGGAFDPDVGRTFIRILSEWVPPLTPTRSAASRDTAYGGREGHG